MAKLELKLIHVNNALPAMPFPCTTGQLSWALTFPEQSVEQTVELSVIWDTMMLMRRHCNDKVYLINNRIQLIPFFIIKDLFNN